MPRNEPKRVDEVTRLRTINYAKALAEVEGPVTLSYVKRNDQPGESTGKVIGFSGVVGFDTFSVTIDTSATKGRPSTINLNGLRSITKPV